MGGDGSCTRAHAKVNLALRVAGKRDDGYHEIWTVFDELDLHDELSFEPGAPGLALDVAGDGEGLAAPSGETNLVLRAARALEATTGERAGGRFRLVKRIPSGAGLGGGSSDAAAALRLLAQHRGLALDAGPVVAAAKQIGADVPFFLHGGRAFATGRGDEVTPLAAAPRLEYVLLAPGFACATPVVYGRWHRELTDTGVTLDSGHPVPGPGTAPSGHGPPEEPQSWLAGLLADVSERGLAQRLFNDLEAAAAAAYPRLARLRARLFEEGFTVLFLSGSGSTLFAAGTSPCALDSLAEDLRRTVLRLQEQGFDGLGPGARVVRTCSRR